MAILEPQMSIALTDMPANSYWLGSLCIEQLKEAAVLVARLREPQCQLGNAEQNFTSSKSVRRWRQVAQGDVIDAGIVVVTVVFGSSDRSISLPRVLARRAVRSRPSSCLQNEIQCGNFTASLNKTPCDTALIEAPPRPSARGFVMLLPDQSGARPTMPEHLPSSRPFSCRPCVL